MKKALLLSVSLILMLVQTHAQSAYFTSDSPRCVSDSVHFTPGPPGGSILKEDWDFGDGTVITYLPPTPFPIFATHLYTNPGTYNVTRTVKFNTVTLSFSDLVQVVALPVANFTSTEACQGDPTQFTDLSVANAALIVSYSWSFGDGGTSSQSSPMHYYVSWGIYTATLTVVNSNGCTHSVTKQVTVKPKPVADFSFPSSNCVGFPVSFYDMSYIPSGFSGYIISWLWEFGDGSPPLIVSFPDNPNVSHTFAGAATAHVVRLTVTTSGGCSAYIEKVVSSAPVPVANFFTAGPSCEVQPVQFIDVSQTNGGGQIVSWAWNFGDPISGANNTSTAQNPVHVFSSAGTFSVALTIVNSNGCINTIVKAVPVNLHPYANFSTDTVHVGTPTTFTDLSVSASGSIVSWLWDFGDGLISSASNPTHAYPLAGIYTARLTVTDNNGCTKDTLKPIIVLTPVNNPPATQEITNVIVGSGQTRCYNATQVITVAGNGTLFYVLAGGNATFIAGQEISFQPGTAIQPGGSMRGYIAPAGPYCVNPSMPADVATGDTGSGNIEQALFKINPNPTTGNFILEYQGYIPFEKGNATLFGMHGEKIVSAIITSDEHHEFTLSGLPAGVYFIRVITGGKVETVKIIKQ